MPYAITIVPVMPLRAAAAHKSEMISQVLWGECVEITDTGTDGWVKVKCQSDSYEGWATTVHLEIIDNQLFNAQVTHFMPHWSNTVLLNGQPMVVPYGCTIKESAGNEVHWGGIKVQFGEEPGAMQPLPAGPAIQELRGIAFRFLNTAYLWGGKSVFGIDCSGFTQSVFKLCGISLLRDAYQQATQGDVLDFLQEARLGDLAFFDNAEGRITHVGILLNDHEIIHAAGKVRVDNIDNQGIINVDTGLRTHQLRIIKRYF